MIQRIQWACMIPCILQCIGMWMEESNNNNMAWAFTFVPPLRQRSSSTHVISKENNPIHHYSHKMVHPRSSSSSRLTMDTEGPNNYGPNIHLNHRAPFVSWLDRVSSSSSSSKAQPLGQHHQHNKTSNTFSSHSNPIPDCHGMPWKQSIQNSSLPCEFMPFWEWQVSHFQQSLKNFKVLSTPYYETTTNNHTNTTTNHKQPYRMITLCASSDEYRYIRITYLDGGSHVQVCTSVYYPRVPAEFPILGMDLMQFQNGKKTVAICDFQPLVKGSSSSLSSSSSQPHWNDYKDYLIPIRQKVPSLHQPMTHRYYNPDHYFSKDTLLLGRSSSSKTTTTTMTPQSSNADSNTNNAKEDSMIWNDFFPSVQAYMETHVRLLKQHQQQQQPSTTTTPLIRMEKEKNYKLHAEYDTYSAECDPAYPMFASIFGSEIAHDFIYNVLFPLATKPLSTPPLSSSSLSKSSSSSLSNKHHSNHNHNHKES